MKSNIIKIKQEMEIELAGLRLKRKNIVTQFKKKIEQAKIDQIKNSILDK